MEQHRCQHRSADKENVVHIHKEKWNDVICGKMVQLETVIFSKLNQTQKHKHWVFSLICGSCVTDTETHVCICDMKGGLVGGEGREEKGGPRCVCRGGGGQVHYILTWEHL